MFRGHTGSNREFSLSILDPDRIRYSTEAIVAFANETSTSRNHAGFWSALRTLQHPDLPLTKPNLLTPVYYDGPNDFFAGAVGALMGGVAMAEDAALYALALRQHVTEAFKEALDLFAAWFPKTFSVFCHTIRYVVFARKQGYSGGTLSSRIGLVWLAPEPHWTAEFWVENLLHEFVHSALFIEDMVHGVLFAGSDWLDQLDAQAISAIRQVKRGYDKSYHSAFVSFTIVEMYRALGRPDLAYPFVAPLVVCLGDLVARRKFATPHGQELLVELVNSAIPVYSEQLTVRSAPSGLGAG